MVGVELEVGLWSVVFYLLGVKVCCVGVLNVCGDRGIAGGGALGIQGGTGVCFVLGVWLWVLGVGGLGLVVCCWGLLRMMFVDFLFRWF